MAAPKDGQPLVTALEASLVVPRLPEITAINYDLWELRLTLDFDGSWPPAYVEFERVCGFRVLDEGDLCEFWGPETRADGWLWRVEAGGWLDLERSRPMFVSGSDDRWCEFLVLGENDCVNVLSDREPRVRVAER